LSRNYSTFLNFSTKFKIKKIDTNQTDSQTWKILRSCAWAGPGEGLGIVGWYLDASGVASVWRWRAG